MVLLRYVRYVNSKGVIKHWPPTKWSKPSRIGSVTLKITKILVAVIAFAIAMFLAFLNVNSIIEINDTSLFTTLQLLMHSLTVNRPLERNSICLRCWCGCIRAQLLYFRLTWTGACMIWRTRWVKCDVSSGRTGTLVQYSLSSPSTMHR